LLSYQTYGKGVDLWAIGCLLCELSDGNPLFPGENEIDQLYLIQKMLGPLTDEQMEVFQKNPRFLGMKFPEIGKPETIERRYLCKLPRKAIGFVKGLLKMDPSDRLTVRDALRHPYFEEMQEVADYIKAFDGTHHRPEPGSEQRISDASSKANIAAAQKTMGSTQMNFIRTKNPTGLSKIPDFLSSQVLMQNTAYNYKIDHTPTDFHSQHQKLGFKSTDNSSKADTIKKTLVMCRNEHSPWINSLRLNTNHLARSSCLDKSTFQTSGVNSSNT
jgi:cyclin-dependent kinase-like